jgi:uncharacterized protein YfkK (UPF0435 family)
MDIQSQEEKYFKEFYTELKYYANLLKTEATSDEIEEFKLLRDIAEFVGKTNSISGSEYMKCICDSYIKRKLDRNVKNWSVIEAIRYNVYHDFKELEAN